MAVQVKANITSGSRPSTEGLQLELRLAHIRREEIELPQFLDSAAGIVIPALNAQ
jgi:hypothetical protein